MVVKHPTKTLRAPRAIIFDTDNTLYAYDGPHAMATAATEAKAVRLLGADPDSVREAFLQAREEVKRQLGATASSHSRLLYFQRGIEMLGRKTQLLITLDLEQTYWRTFLSNAVLFDGLKEFLDELRLAGVPTAIVTDLTAQIQFRKIVYFGLDHFFDYIVTSEEAGFDKPHPAPFRIAVEKMRPTGDCIWMVGDNPVNDIAGARKAIGAVTIQKLHGDLKTGEGENQPDCTIRTFAQLSSIFGRCQGD